MPHNENKRPNILFITTDQQRWDTLGCYGNEHINTPAIDSLASEAMIFNRAYCENPICIPSRVTMITGLTSSHHGATLHNSSMQNGEQTIGQTLANYGYTTHFIGKPHFKSQQHPGTEESIIDWRAGKYEEWNGPYVGFQEVDLILGHSNSLLGHYGAWLRENHKNDYHHFKLENLEKLNVSCGQGVYKNNIPEHITSSTYVGNQVCNLLEGTKKSKKPFYCFASFPDPHWPIMPPKRFFEMYDGTNIPTSTPFPQASNSQKYPRQFGSVQSIKEDSKQSGGTGYNGGGHLVNNLSDIEKITRPYWGAISHIDDNVGRIINQLKALDLYDNTIIVYTTDHGEYMGDHGMMAKGGFLWESLIRVPLIIKPASGLTTPTSTNALFSHVDVVPTLLSMANIAEHEMALDGINQQDVATGKLDSIREHLTVMQAGAKGSHQTPDIHCLVTKDWKLNYYAGDPAGELYNLADDPAELTNLYNDSQQKIQQELTQILMDEIILQNDKRAVNQLTSTGSLKTAGPYGQHVMDYAIWKKEFDELQQITGKS